MNSSPAPYRATSVLSPARPLCSVPDSLRHVPLRSVLCQTHPARSAQLSPQPETQRPQRDRPTSLPAQITHHRAGLVCRLSPCTPAAALPAALCGCLSTADCLSLPLSAVSVAGGGRPVRPGPCQAGDCPRSAVGGGPQPSTALPRLISSGTRPAAAHGVTHAAHGASHGRPTAGAGRHRSSRVGTRQRSAGAHRTAGRRLTNAGRRRPARWDRYAAQGRRQAHSSGGRGGSRSGQGRSKRSDRVMSGRF